jgi:diguanylate cyclase (GGDEF)-like protein
VPKLGSGKAAPTSAPVRGGAGIDFITAPLAVLALIILPIVYLRARGRIKSIQAQAAELEALAGTDPVTGVANRSAWDADLPRELARAQRDAGPLCVAIVGIDQFTTFMASHSRAEADALLRQAASEWRSSLRVTDLLARFRPDEFAVVLPGCDVAQAEEVIDRLCDATPGGQTCSAGITAWDGQETSQSLVLRAEGAFNHATGPDGERVTVELPPAAIASLSS